MAMLNYDTTVDVEKTLVDIHRMLVRSGARRISVEYNEHRQPTAVTFVIALPFGETPYRLPANTTAVYALLERQWQDGMVRRGLVTVGQASRVGWRIVKDWLEAQLTIIDSGLVTLDQVMLPYNVVALEDGREGTFYDAWRAHRGKLPGPDPEDGAA